MLIIPPFLLIRHHYVTMITGSHFVRAHDIPGDWLPVGGEYPFAREKVREDPLSASFFARVSIIWQ